MPKQAKLAATRRGLVTVLMAVGFSAPAWTQVTLLDQIEPLAQTMAFFAADSSCNQGVTVSLAEDFVITNPVQATTLEFHGLYSLPAAPSDPTPFVFRILADSAGLPGALVAQPSASVIQTSLSSTQASSVYQFVATFAPVLLAPGTYWVEIYETDSSTDNCFRWRSGPLDATRGRDGLAESFTVPGSAWAAPALSATNLSLRIFGQPASVVQIPALGALGLAALAALLGAGAIARLRRRT
jgi:hypothetical protein